MRVSKFSYKMMALLALASFCLAPSGMVCAQVPVTDAESTAHGIKGVVNNIKEMKVVKDSVAFAGKTSTAIGDAKKSVTEYVIKNKEKAEKQIEKAEKYKKRAEAYKKEYEAYKKEYDGYKADLEKGIADAKKAQADIKEGMETAKEVSSGVKSMAESKINSAKNKAGIDSNPSQPDARTQPESNNTAPSFNDSPSSSLEETDENIITAPTENTPSRQPFANGSVPVDATKVASPELDKDGAVVETEILPAIGDTEGEPLDPAVAVSGVANNISAPVVSSQPQNLKAKLEMRSTPQSTKTRTPMRSSFKRLEKQSSLGSNFSISQQTPLAFASLLSLPDGGTNAQGDMIIPPSLGMSCGINSEDALKEGVVDACLVRINDMQKRAQSLEVERGDEIYHEGLKRYAAAYIAEAVKAKNDSDEFMEKVVEPVSFAVTTQENDDYANIVEMNKAVVMTINNLLKLYSAKLALDTYQNYGTYKFSSPEEE